MVSHERKVDQRPIGILDSGVGGLTVARAINKLLPDERLIYFGDTAHMPYGDKSKELVASYVATITDFLLSKDCKAIVIACNTASAAAYEKLRDTFKGRIPIINVIDPMIEAVIADESVNRVGIIATKTTVGSGVYQEKFARRKPGLDYRALATPLLASMIEEGFYDDNISHSVVAKYLSHPSLEGIDGIVLACTHYPLIKKDIADYLGSGVRIFDSAEVVARKLKDILVKEGLSAVERTSQNMFFVSDFTESFERTTRIFFGEEVHLERAEIWG